MLRYKVFNAGDPHALEGQVNAWLLEAEPDIKLMEQTALPGGGFAVGFLYDEGFMAAEHRITASAEATAILEHALREQPLLEPIKVDQEQV